MPNLKTWKDSDGHKITSEYWFEIDAETGKTIVHFRYTAETHVDPPEIVDAIIIENTNKLS